MKIGSVQSVHLDHLPGTFYGPANLVEMVRHRARCQPDDTAFIYLTDGENDAQRMTYRELDRQARAIGAWLEARHLTGERALLLYPAGLEFIAAFFGCLYAGVIAVPVYPPRRNRSLKRIQSVADDADATIALTTDSVLERILPLIDETPHLKRLNWMATCHVPDGIEEKWDMPDVHGDTLAFLQYTSGSTGTPKGVALCHANLVHNSALIAYAYEHTRSGGGVFWLPSYHDMGLIGGILQPLYVGRPNVLMAPMSFLQKPYRWLAAISRYRCSTSGGPNFAYELCVKKVTPEQRKTLDLSHWTVAFNGAEPVRAETIDAFCEAFEPCGFRREAFYPCFGLAEATLIVSGGRVQAPPIIKTFDAEAISRGQVVEVASDAENAQPMVGCGENLPDQKIVIAEPDSMTVCPPDRIGEIWVRGPSMAMGYWRNQEATEQTFHAHLKDTGEGPFMRTGDLGFMSGDELFVTGRLKDLIIIRGVNHYPQDIEQTVQRAHPRLRTDGGGVFTLEREGRERLVIVQEVERHKHGDFEPVFEAIRKAIAVEHELAPDAIVLIKAGSVPKTSSGKIQRHACRAGYLDGTLDVIAKWEGEGGVVKRPEPRQPRKIAALTSALAVKPAASTPVSDGFARTLPRASKDRAAEIVLEEISRVAKERAKGLTLDSPIVETGMDSLERMEIVASLEERFGGRFPEDILVELETARQLIAAVEKYLGGEPRPQGAVVNEGEIPPSQYKIAEFPEVVQLRERLDYLESSPLGNPFFTVHEGLTNNRTTIGGREMINFSNYNYIGMSGHPEVSAAAKAAIDRFGTSASASRLVSGQKTVHVELEKAIADFVGVEDSIVFVGGHATNESVVGHMMGPGDLILHDALAHNSIVEGAILSGARRRPFAHNDWTEAERILSQYRGEYRRVLIAVEGVYSMDGDIADLPKFIEVKKRHKALLMVDEAHSMGILGETGRGIGEHFHVNREDVEIWMGTLSKSFGSCGGYIAGSKSLADYLRYTAPGFVFAAGMPPSAAAAAVASIRVLEREPERCAKLLANSALFLKLCKENGLNTGMSGHSPVVPVILGNSIHCLTLSRAMMARGVNVQPILHPAVEEKAARLRFFISSEHTDEEIRFTVETMTEELKKIDLSYLKF